jgi:RNA polymerase sigma-70 factor (ECF subfamily)
MTGPERQSESDLLRRAIAGDEDAFRVLYRQFQGPIYRFALHMAGSPAVAEDVTQEVFMTLIEKKSRFDSSRGSLRSYFLGTTRNLLLRRFDTDHRFVALQESESPNGAASGNHAEPSVQPSDLVRSENIERVRQAVLGLPAEYRETVVLCDLQELSYEQAAEVLGCPIGTVRSRLHRARTMLAEKLRIFTPPARRFSAAGQHGSSASGLYLQPGQKKQ